MDSNVFAFDAAAFAGASESFGAEQYETFGRHSGRGEVAAEVDHALGAIAGLLLELADRGGRRLLAIDIVADQPGGQLEARAAERHPILLDEQDMAVVDGEDHRRADAARARHIFPFAAPLDGDEPPLPGDVLGLVGFLRHSSTSRSGSSLGLSASGGRKRASTAPTNATALARPSPGRPAFTSSTSAAIASRLTSGTTLPTTARS